MNIDTTISSLDIGIIVVYLIVLILIGFWGYGKNKLSTDLFLGDRSISWPGVGFSLFSTNVSPMMLLGFAGLAYSTGIVGSNFEWLAWPFLMLLAMVFIPHYLHNKISTMPEFLKLRFGHRSYVFLSIYSLFSILVIWLGSALYAGGLIISQILGIELWVAVMGISIIATSYTAVGGLKAIVRTDVFQSVLIILGSTLLTGIALHKIGGIGELMASTPSDYWDLFRPIDDPVYPWHAIVLGYPVVGIYYWCTDQTIVQKVLAAKSIKDGQKGALFTSMLKIIMPFIFLFPGIMCFVLFPDLDKPDHAYMTMITNLLPTGLIGLIVAGLLAALINTVAAGLNSFSTVFTLDVYKRVINPNITPEQTQKTGQIMTVIAAVVAFMIAIIFSNTDKNLFDITQGVASLLAPPLSVVFLTGVLWKNATSRAAEIILYGGGFVCIVLGTCHIFNYPSKDFWPHFMLLSFYLFLGLQILMVVLSLLTPRDKVRKLPTIKETYSMMNHKHSSTIWLWWGIVGIIMLGIYIFFN